MSDKAPGAPPNTLRVAFLGCGFITGVHSRHLRAIRRASNVDIVCAYASREKAKAEEFCREFGGVGSYGSYEAAIEDPGVDAVVVAVPPRYHLGLTLKALEAGKHVLVEKPAFLRVEDYLMVRDARDRAGRTVLVGENDHYKPAAVRLRKLVADRVDRRHGLRALHDDRASASRAPTTGGTTKRSPAATPFSRKAFTGCTSPAASARRSPPRTASGPRRRGKDRTGASRA